MSVVLMYHALYRGTDTSDITQEDLPYAVSEADFTAQLDSLLDKRVGLFESTLAPEIVITFDDGHESNLEIAMPLLQARGMSAYFFITSDFIDQRPGFMSSEQLHRLSETAGMCIGSHGVSHRFFDDLSKDEGRSELVRSREFLESLTGRNCQSMSFPGGRYDEQTLHLLQDAGYRQWFGSQIGTVEAAQCFGAETAVEKFSDGYSLIAQRQWRAIDRVAIRRTTTLDEFARITAPDAGYYKHHRMLGQIKSLMRRSLGNRLYHGLYKSLSAR